jgi:hypothetical protein
MTMESRPLTVNDYQTLNHECIFDERGTSR